LRCRDQPDALGSALVACWRTLVSACHCMEPEPVAKLLTAIAEIAPPAILQELSQLVAQTFAQRPAARVVLVDPLVSLAHSAKREPDAAKSALICELAQGLVYLVWKELDARGWGDQRWALVTDSQVRSPDEGRLPVEGDAHDRRLAEALHRGVLEVGRCTPGSLNAETLHVTVQSVVSVLAVPHQEPPARCLALLAEVWADARLKTAWRQALSLRDFPCSGWCAGSLLCRSLLKALLGQMPLTAVGIVVPAIRGLLLVGGPLFMDWMREAVDGKDFPSASVSTESKDRFLVELAAADPSTPHFKRLLKSFCKR